MLLIREVQRTPLPPPPQDRSSPTRQRRWGWEALGSPSRRILPSRRRLDVPTGGPAHPGALSPAGGSGRHWKPCSLGPAAPFQRPRGWTGCPARAGSERRRPGLRPREPHPLLTGRLRVQCHHLHRSSSPHWPAVGAGLPRQVAPQGARHLHAGTSGSGKVARAAPEGQRDPGPPLGGG